MSVTPDQSRCELLRLVEPPLRWRRCEQTKRIHRHQDGGAGVRENRQKFYRLQAEHQEFLALAPASTPISPSAPANFVMMEKAVLRYAFEHQGKVYPELLVIESDFSLSEVEQFLKHAVEKRLATVEIDANGRAFYYFSSLDNSDPYSALNQTMPK